MRLGSPDADVFVPDGTRVEAALPRVRAVGVGAHPDDLEIVALPGILDGHRAADGRFAGVVCADGAGSPRTGPFAGVSDAEMAQIRAREQRAAAELGQFGVLVQLSLPSARVKNGADPTLRRDLEAVFRATNPEVVYTHNLADRHDTHVAVALAVIDALQALPPEARPRRVYGCEVWRSLDWLPDAVKVRLPAHDPDGLGVRLLAAHASQIGGGKRYDLAAAGRRRSNATFDASHAIDEADEVLFAMDLSPLVADPTLTPAAYVEDLLRSFVRDVLGAMRTGP